MSLHCHFGRPLGAGHAVLHDLRQPAPGVEAQQLDLDRELRDPLSNDRVVRHSALAGEVLDLFERDATPAADAARGRPLVHQW